MGISTPPRPRACPRWSGRPLQPADVKRGSWSRAGQSAAEGGGAKRWPERDREPLFYYQENSGLQVYPDKATVTNLLRIASVSGVSGVAAASSSSVACPVSVR